jgi:hypothetical protein
LSKSKTSLSSRKAYAQLEEYLRRGQYCQPNPGGISTDFRTASAAGKCCF